MLKITLFKLKHFTNTLYDYNETFFLKKKLNLQSSLTIWLN